MGCCMKKSMTLLKISIIMLFVSTIAIILTPLTDYNAMGGKKFFSVFISFVLWIGIITGYIYLIFFYRGMQKSEKKGRIGVISFFSNRYSVFIDLIFILSLILIVVFAIINFRNTFVFSLLFGVIFISANLHCIFNGRVFNKLIEKKRREDNE